MKAVITAGVSGLIFALGLGVAGMTDPAKVIGFLDVAGKWDPTLAFVMGGAMGTYALLRKLIHRRPKPVLAPAFPSLGKPKPDRRLLLGAGMFGVGWGIAGYCPGPGIVSVTTGVTAGLFVLAMGAGMMIFRVWDCANEAKKSAASATQSTTPEIATR